MGKSAHMGMGLCPRCPTMVVSICHAQATVSSKSLELRFFGSCSARYRCEDAFELGLKAIPVATETCAKAYRNRDSV
jgi:hypothetical protein